MFNAEVSRLIASVTTLGCSVHVFFLRLHHVSFGFISHFTIFKPNTAMQQSAPPPHQGVDGLAAAYFGATPVATSNSPLASK